MQRERISDDIFVFTSGMYAQVTAGAVLTTEGAVVIDTLPFPGETRQIVDFISKRSPNGIRYVILTHYHADHTYGAYLFRNSEVVSHVLCRDWLVARGQAGLETSRAQTPDLAEVQLRIPDVVFEGRDMTLRMGNKTLQLLHSPGHTPDSIVVYIKEDKILFSADTVMPVPFIVDGDPQTFIESLKMIRGLGLENVVQGHGEVVLRGEINEAIDSSVRYLELIQGKVSKSIAAQKPRDAMREISIESCGKSRIPLNGLVQQLHVANLMSLYDRASTGDKRKPRKSQV
jgi:glyoxylase-like metal-dependent hydrolase (beta-lactamase superfamily II)